MRQPIVHALVAALAAAGLVGCGPSAPALPAPVASAIRLAPAPERIHAINDAAHRHRGPSASLTALLVDADPQVRWGAAYVAALWADDAADVEALAPYLNQGDDATRAMIAGSLAGLGHDGARQTLTGLKASREVMPFSDPPLTVGRFATGALAEIDRAGVAR